jgi:hypothetical protein
VCAGARQVHKAHNIQNDPMPGVLVNATFIITFNQLLLTKLDRAYMVRCYYMEAEKMVMTELEVK